MQKPRPVPFSASILSLTLLLYAGSICADDGFRKRTPQSIVEQSLSPIETIVIDHSSFAVNPTNIVIDSRTIAPTLPAVTIDHAVISVDKSYNVFVNGSEAIVGIPVPPRTSTSQISSSLSKSYGVTSSSSPSGSPAHSSTSSDSYSAAHVSSRSGSELSDRSTAFTRSPLQSLLTGSGTASLSSRFSETSRQSAQSGLPVLSGSGSRSVPNNRPKSSSIPHNTGRSLSSDSRAASGSRGGSGSGTGNTTMSSHSQSGESTSSAPAISRNATASIKSKAGSTPAPGSTGKIRGPSVTSGSTRASAPSGSSKGSSGPSSTTSFDLPNTTQAGGIPITSLPRSGPAASSQRSVLGGLLLGFVSDGRSWVSDITLPAIKTQAINEIEDLKGNTENAIKNLGGPFPPTSNACSSGSSRKRLFDPIGAVEGLADDALGLANCVDNILTDISNDIGPITGPPPPQDVIGPISTLMDALEKAGEEEDDDDNQSTKDTNSKTKGSTTSSKSSAMTSSKSSASSVHSKSSQTSSQTSSAVSGCPSFVYPDDDLEEWEGPPLDGNINKRTLGIRGRWDRRPREASDGNVKPEKNLDRRHELMKREQAAAITSINSCNFPAGKQGVQPGYSGLKAFKGLNQQRNSNNGRSGAVYDAVPKWYVGSSSCSLPNGFAWYKTDDESPTGIPAGSKQSVDHVYEKQLVNLFLQTVIDTPSFTCADMEKVFFDGCVDTSLMQTVFNQLPGMQFSNQLTNNPPLYENTNPGFVGLEQSINGVKGYMFDKGINPPSTYFQNGRINGGIQMQIQTIQDFIMLFDILRDKEVENMFDVTNDRIYKAYQTVDARITSQNIQKSDGSGRIEANFAATYKTWLTGYLTDIVKPAWSWCSNTVTSIETSLNGKTDDVSVAQMKLLNEIKAWSGFAEDRFAIDWSLSWSTGTLRKRELAGRQASPSDGTDAAACAYTASGTELSRSSTGSASVAASTSITGSSNTITAGPTRTKGAGTIGSSHSSTSYACYPYEDPDAGPVTPECQCDGLEGFYPYVSSTSGQSKYNPCGYTTSPTRAPATSVKPFTTTNSEGEVVSCASSTYYNYAVNTIPTCAGATKVVSTVASIASVHSASVASSVSAASIASVASASNAAWSSAAAVPSAACWILSDDGFGDSSFEVYGINGWAGPGGSSLWKQENGCGIVSGGEFYTDGSSEFEGRLRDTQYAYFGLSFFKGGCVERAVHSAGGPAPGTGPGQIACQHVPSKLDGDQLDAVNRISGPQLKAVQAVADGNSTTSSLPNATEDDVVQPGESSSASTGGSSADLVASASAALSHLSSAANAASSAPAPTGT